MTHAVSQFCRGEKCGPCLRAGVQRQATHKIGEEIFSDDPMPIRHNLTQYVCCSCYALLMGSFAQQLCGIGLPGLPRLVPVYGVLGEKLVECGTVVTEHPARLARLPPEVVAHPFDGTAIDRQRVSRAERDLRASLSNLSAHLGLPVSAKIVLEEDARD